MQPQLRHDVLSQLRCTNCSEFFKKNPIRKSGPKRLCEECFSNLNEIERISFDEDGKLSSLADLLVFNCKYARFGCKFSYTFGNGGEHEEKCRFSNGIEECRSLDEESNIYETIDRKHCSNCRGFLGERVYHCSVGHVSCFGCKEGMCLICSKELWKQQLAHCPNFQRGCKENVSFLDLHNHQTSCPFAMLNCPIPKCEFKSILADLKHHLLNEHENCYTDSLFRGSFSKKDNVWFMLCHGTVFKCVYFFFKDFVEFSVVCMGSAEEALGFSFKVSLGKNGVGKKSQVCASWNNRMIDPGIVFPIGVLMGEDRKVLFSAEVSVFYNGRSVMNG